MATTTKTEAVGLSFPAQTFQKLSPGSYLLRHLQATEPTRPSARSPEAFRAPSLHTDSLSHTHGSAVVRTGDTAVVCGVRGEILGLTHGEGKTKGKIEVHRSVADGSARKMDVDDEIKTHSLLVPNLELGTGCSRDYHPGPPSDFAQAAAEHLRSLLIDTAALVPATTLRIRDDDDGETKAYWVLYIDIVCISLDGNVLDAAWAALVAALRSARLPSAAWDADKEMVVCDPDPAKYRALELREPVFVASFCVFGNDGEQEEDDARRRWVLSDPDEFEESVCVERVLVCVGAGGKIKGIEKSGGLTNVVDVLPMCIGRAKERYEMWVKMLS